jgi:hypothetical protein
MTISRISITFTLAAALAALAPEFVGGPST